MATPHICHVDCKLIHEGARTIHMMHAAEPSSAAGRYQWEQNAAIKRQGRRAWRATGQGESREVRVWNERRKAGQTATGTRRVARQRRISLAVFG